jgi:hypothetical protein
MIIILENKNPQTDEWIWVFKNRKEADDFLSSHPQKESYKLNELTFDSFPFFMVYEFMTDKDELILCTNNKDAILSYVKNIDLGKFSYHHEDPNEDDIFVIELIEKPFCNDKEMGFVNHGHVMRIDIKEMKSLIEKGYTERAKRHLFNFYGATRLGIFWLNDSLDDILYSKTVYEEDIDKTDPGQYGFSHSIEWEHRPKDIEGNYDDYPRGRIYYHDNKYRIEINTRVKRKLKERILMEFELPWKTIFSCGYW